MKKMNFIHDKQHSTRNDLIQKLHKQSTFSPGDIGFYHGKLIGNSSNLPGPKGKELTFKMDTHYMHFYRTFSFSFLVTWGCTEFPSENMYCDSPPWLTASQFLDSNQNLKVKSELLINLLRYDKKDKRVYYSLQHCSGSDFFSRDRTRAIT